jgi:hypothetical protein
MDPQTAKLLPILLPVLILGLVLRRSLKPQPLRIERMWLYPVILIFLLGSSLYQSPPTTMLAIGFLAGGLVLGAAAGWYRGRLTRITIDPDTHVLTSQASMWGTVLVVGLIVVRYGLRAYLMGGIDMSGATPHGGLGGPAIAATDALLSFTVGMMGVSRLEMWMRASKLLADAQAAKAGR